MSNTVLYTLWGGFYILSIVLGFIPEPEGFVKVLLMVLGAMTFVPPSVLLYRGQKDLALTRRVRTISLIALSATLLLMVGNILSVFLSELAGDFLYFLLAVVSAPMLCIQYKAVSLFAWACLLMTALNILHQQKKAGK